MIPSGSIKLATFVTMFFLAGCYYDREAILYPETNCTVPADPTFSADVLPLMNTKCNSCHSGSFASAGIKLNSFAEVTKYTNNGSLMGSINHASGFSPMPKNSSKMSACEIEKIQKWISSGANNN